jgi:hypothetical protein
MGNPQPLRDVLVRENAQFVDEEQCLVPADRWVPKRLDLKTFLQRERRGDLLLRPTC